MLYSSVLLCAASSFFLLRTLAAPIPPPNTRALSIRATPSQSGGSGGWPHSTSDDKSTFGISGNYKPSYLKEEEGSAVLVGNYPKGSYAGSKNPGIAGFIFEATGNADLDNAKEAVLTYQVKFQSDFGFAFGGKMPGLYGGADPATAKECAGGHHSDTCWSARIMWRDNGKAELYAYLPTANQDLPICKGKCDVKYGASIDTGFASFKAGEWASVTERVLLNDVGKKNAEIEITIDGKEMKVTGLQLRGDEKGRIRGAMVHTFFGGSSSTKFESPKDQEAYFKDFKIEVTKKL